MLTQPEIDDFQRRLLDWYKVHRRRLPWRRNPTPYRVWISEVMLQQTTVPTVKARFEAWMKRFPDVASLSRAQEHEVLAAWEGLGYYRRAINLRRAAQAIVRFHDRQIPRDRKELLSLPGIGPYIAAAVRSIAFGQDEVALDANVARVFMRLQSIEGYATDSAVRRAIAACADRALPSGRASEYNQALMDLGSLICRPVQPLCADCFASGVCHAFREGLQNDIPRRRPKSLKRIRTAVAIFINRNRIYLQRRGTKGMFAGMWEFPGGKVEEGETPRAALVREVREELSVECETLAALPPIVHYYTVFRVTLYAFVCRTAGELPTNKSHRWVKIADLAKYPMPSANRRLIEVIGALPS